ncbi:hypothetical protein GUITHDRAFT_121879 [Guillardia theta CCMP2712]|uniref:RWP-RK domain-containing protein n=1 Tax=Guillardia theta (strain CCMP2712) TaxID=905079 RepID=L1I7A0_GUITC|nr:hypothetical protein GUITHDRAFT_121879 [Guillardia theta CCMP2712]EKX31952.1 hypothetical protein GUITHDRAFT_121879 [Guillardia theta CCMP2712]|eukprot:XP_005818932.1 hypothetical protein GUITHDRAFT_121879 [Guillardia theta CCMP2712]
MTSSHSKKASIALSYDSIAALFPLRQVDAAKTLGVSLTALKKACKQVGIAGWPYSRQHQGRSSANQPSSEQPSEEDGEGGEGGEGGEDRREGQMYMARGLFEEALEHVEGRTATNGLRKKKEQKQRQNG